ncbi:MAG: hypothetical protein EBR01_15040, partial [Proteobacteria bacterium]|nr:hypothetical protein [Pseudomonadota bacterium]
LFVSHNMGSIQNLCTQGILLEKGKIQAKGDILNIVDLYSKSCVSFTKIKRQKRQGYDIFISEAETLFRKETRELVISLEIDCVKAAKVSVECRLLDTFRAPLAFLSRGRLDLSQKIGLKKGKNNVVLAGKLPRLIRGRYYLWISIADPLVTFLDSLENMLECDLEFFPEVGSQLDLSPGLGFGHLDIPLSLSKQN